MPAQDVGRDLWALARAITLAALTWSLIAPAHAEVRVSGEPDAVLIEAAEATVEEVMAALRTSFNVQYRTGAELNRPVSGSYRGSLQRVIARLLTGYDHAIRSNADGIAVVVFGPAGSSPVAGRPGGGPTAVNRPPMPAAASAPARGGPEGWNGAPAARKEAPNAAASASRPDRAAPVPNASAHFEPAAATSTASGQQSAPSKRQQNAPEGWNPNAPAKAPLMATPGYDHL